MDEGFVDLRQGSDHGNASESFWPSFTDVMMVVLMIFMIASTILMLRNWELVKELRSTIESEHQAEAMARSAARNNETLEERLAQAQSELSELRLRLMRAAEQSQTSERENAELRRQLLVSQGDAQQASDRLQQVQSDLDRINTAYGSLQKTAEELRAVEKERGAELARLRQQYAESEQQLTALRGSYDDLSVKYDKLVKPARTAAGKYLVSVRYHKESGKHVLEFKENEQGDYRVLSRRQLDERLSSLKAEYRGQLYVKVVIPEDSGLSYNEAWTFTQDILTSYDYYYQE